MRKLTLFITGGLMLMATMGFASESAGAAEINQWCIDNQKGPGIYNDAGKKKRFDLAVNPDTEFQKAEVTGGANLCGTDPNLDLFFDSFAVLTPGKKEEIHCTNPASTVQYCLDQQDPDLPDGAYAGDAVADLWCTAFICAGNEDNRDVETKNYVDYDTSNPNFPNFEPNNCTEEAVACLEARATVLGIVDCNADAITTKDRKKFRFTIYPPKCYIGGAPITGDIFIYNIDDLRICQYASTSGDSCGSDPSLWQFQNGKAKVKNGQVKPLKWKGEAHMTDGTLYKAKAKVKWMPQ